MTSGVATNVTPKRSGGTLATDTLSTDTVLLLDDAADFDEDFEGAEYLVIGEETTRRQYVAVANDEDAQQSVTLAAAVGGVYEAGLPVTPWDPDSAAADKRAVEYVAWVRLDDSGKPIPATLHHTQIPLSGPAVLVGARATIEQASPTEWRVAEVLGREPVVDQSVIESPAYSVQLASSETIPHGTLTALTAWEGADGTDDNDGEAGGAPEGRGGWYKSSAREYSWATV